MIISYANPELFKEVEEERKTLKQQYDDAMKASEEVIKEISKGHGEDAKKKKITSPDLRKMHLSEKLFPNYFSLNESMDEIARKGFASLNSESVEPGHYYILIDGTFEDDFYADSDDEAIEIFNDWHRGDSLEEYK